MTDRTCHVPSFSAIHSSLGVFLDLTWTVTIQSRMHLRVFSCISDWYCCFVSANGPSLSPHFITATLFFDCRVCCVWSSPCILVDHFHGGIECSCWSVRHSGGILAAVVPASYVPAPAVFVAADATILPLLAKAFLALPQRYLPTRCYSLGRRGFWSNGSSRNGGISTMNTFVPLLFSGSNGGGAPGRRRRHHCNWIGALDAAISFRCLVTVSWPLRPSSFLNLFPPTCNGRSRSILRSSFDRT